MVHAFCMLQRTTRSLPNRQIVDVHAFTRHMVVMFTCMGCTMATCCISIAVRPCTRSPGSQTLRKQVQRSTKPATRKPHPSIESHPPGFIAVPWSTSLAIRIPKLLQLDPGCHSSFPPFVRLHHFGIIVHLVRVHEANIGQITRT
jgi:hypothetical protein